MAISIRAVVAHGCTAAGGWGTTIKAWRRLRLYHTFRGNIIIVGRDSQEMYSDLMISK